MGHALRRLSADTNEYKWVSVCRKARLPPFWGHRLSPLTGEQLEDTFGVRQQGRGGLLKGQSSETQGAVHQATAPLQMLPEAEPPNVRRAVPWPPSP